MRIEAPFNIEDVKEEIEDKKEIEDFDIDKFESDDKELSEIIQYTRKTHNKDLLNLCERMYYSIKNGVRIDQYIYTAKELYKEIKYDNLVDEYNNKISKIKELEKKLKEEIAKQDELKNAIKSLKEKHQIDTELLNKYAAKLESMEKDEEPLMDDYEDDDVKDFSSDINDNDEKIEEKNPNINLLLLDDDITIDFTSYEEKELEDNKTLLEYQTDDNKKYISIVDTNLDELVNNINRMYITAEKMNTTKEKKEVIEILNDVLKDIETFYKYKEYVRYYYNKYKNKLNKALDYENHKKLLLDLTDKINVILNSIRYYLSINDITFKELYDKYNFNDMTSIIVYKLLDVPGFVQPINTNDVLNTLYNKELINNKTLK